MLTPKTAKWILWIIWAVFMAISMGQSVMEHGFDLFPFLQTAYVAALAFAGIMLCTHWFWKKTGLIKEE